MAVYTDVPDDELKAFLSDYALGEPVSCKGIAEGVENSNYLLRTERGTFILTLYEKRVAPAELPFFLALMDHLAQKGIACPDPGSRPRRQGAAPALRQTCGDRELPRWHVAAPDHAVSLRRGRRRTGPAASGGGGFSRPARQ